MDFTTPRSQTRWASRASRFILISGVSASLVLVSFIQLIALRVPAGLPIILKKILRVMKALFGNGQSLILAQKNLEGRVGRCFVLGSSRQITTLARSALTLSLRLARLIMACSMRVWEMGARLTTPKVMDRLLMSLRAVS